MTLTLDYSFKITANPLFKDTPLVKYESDWTKGREHMVEQGLSDNSAMTLTLDLESCFNITANPLSKGTLQVQYDPDQAKERREKICPDNDLGRTDGWTDGWLDGWMDRLITKIHPQSEVLIISVSEHQKKPKTNAS